MTEYKKNDLVELDITDLTTEGAGLGRVGELVVFVEGALPGERVAAKLLKVKSSYAFGKLLEILKPSSTRVEPVCGVSARCGGCSLMHMSYSAQLDFKRKQVIDALERIGGFKNPPVEEIRGMNEPLRYRNKARYPVQSIEGRAVAGFYAARSHRLVELGDCRISGEENERILGIITRFMNENDIKAYDETAHKGIVRQIMIRKAGSSGEIMVCIVINARKLPKAEKLVTALRAIEGVASITVNINMNKTNAILGRETQVLWGKAHITDVFAGLRFNISAPSFYQVNTVQTLELYNAVLELAKPKGDEVLLDAYCGIGTIGLFMAKHVRRVVGIEIVEDAVNDARENSVINGISNAEFIVGAAEAVLSDVFKDVVVDIAVLDPPRKGAEQAFLDKLLEIAPRKIVYVSCSPQTFARDAKMLSARYKLESVRPVDMFPFTTHVELVGLFTRVEG